MNTLNESIEFFGHPSPEDFLTEELCMQKPLCIGVGVSYAAPIPHGLANIISLNKQDIKQLKKGETPTNIQNMLDIFWKKRYKEVKYVTVQ